MRASARILGRELGMSAREFNSLLLEHGYLEGEPGMYRVTEKGERYAHEQDEFRGNPRSLTYSAQWSTRSWDEQVLAELERERAAAVEATTEDDGAVEATRDETAVVDEAPAEIDYYDYDYDSYDEDDSPSTPSLKVAAAMFVLAAGVRAASDPDVRRWVRERTQPHAEKVWRKVRRGQGAPSDVPAEDQTQQATTAPTDPVEDTAAGKPSD